MMQPLVAAPAAILWATSADRLGDPARALRRVTLWSAVALALLPLARTPLGVSAVLLANGAAATAVVPLVDSISVEWVRAHPRWSYARLRLFGSLGFIVAAQGLGVVLAGRGDRGGDLAVPLAMAACAGGLALLARRLPAPPPPEARPAAGDFAALLRNRGLQLLLAACALHWAACAPYHLLFGVFVRDAGLPSTVIGLAMAVGVGAEVLLLVAYPALERRVGLRGVFVLAFAGSAVRWLLLAGARGAVPVVAVQALHALTFGAFWGGAVSAMSRVVPAGLRATGQALFSAVVFGGGNAAGYWLSGAGYDRLGGVGPLYAAAAAVELAPLLLSLAAAGRVRKNTH
jgi:PPP family 3-phenylpropionic acid transporter